jgi:hypothetical protein
MEEPSSLESVEEATPDDQKSLWISSRHSKVMVDTYKRDRQRRLKRLVSRPSEMLVPVPELVEE